MSDRFSGNLVEEIKSRCDLVEIVGEQISLEKRGENYVGLCPFHQEKTPSFSVSPEKQLYYCFGCGASGDIFSFVMQTENMSFTEAKSFLARRAGVVLPDRTGGFSRRGDEQKTVQYSLNRMAMEFYQHILLEKPVGRKALQYLENRGIERSSLESFGVGFAPPGWDILLKEAVRKGHEPRDLVEAGLVAARKTGGFYDRFRNRVIFPIFDYRERVIGFGGRSLEEDERSPKYLNSPGTQLFDKRRVLYGIEKAMKEIRREKKAVVVEGYTDVILTHQEGITNTVASLGTALTQMQAHLLRAQAREVVIAYDADSAGEAATERGLDILRRSGCTVRVVSLPGGADPDSFIRSNGREAFENLMEAALPLTSYRLNKIKEKYDLDRMEDRLGYIQEAMPVLVSINNRLEKEEYLKEMAEELDVSEGALRTEIKKFTQKQRKEERKGNNLGKIEQTMYIRPNEIDPAEKVILSLLFVDEGVFNRVVERRKDISFSNNMEKIFAACSKTCEMDSELKIDRLRGYLSDESLYGLIVSIDFDNPWEGFSNEEIMRVVDDCIQRLKIKKMAEDRTLIEKKIKEMELAGGQGETIRLLLAEWENIKQAEQELCGEGKREG